MPRFLWTTDVHLDFLTPPQIDHFLTHLHQEQPDAVLVGGDIGEAPYLLMYLNMLEKKLQTPIYFVLGNHDFYRSSIAEVRQQVRALCQNSPFLRWLPAETVIELTPEVGLVGHDGWGDARLGDVRNMVGLSDAVYIQDLSMAENLIQRLYQLGDEAANHLRQTLPAALATYAHVLVLTHVPPFQEACWHEGRLSDNGWVPRFTCHAVGQVIWEMAQTHPQKQITVLCGHTHGEGEAHLRDNLHVITGGTDYGSPRINRSFNF
ncbi:MAG: metallophosphoesterase [Anaerolineae bacterium]|nr:metallophosphoesterase [Anaerolineae bacterium]